MKIGVVGLGYVGLPLMVELSRHFPVIGIDTDTVRVAQLKTKYDRKNVVHWKEIADLAFSDDYRLLADCDAIIITLPTPINEHKKPEVSAIIDSATRIRNVMRPNTLVILESTVYPGFTEEILVPWLEGGPGFRIGYSPERVSPGKDAKRLTDIVKVISGDSASTVEDMKAIYTPISKAVHVAPNIKTAEASKILENIQRDVNIALMNEMATVFDKMGIETYEVLQAARTKWNFGNYFPGMVGGHCIAVDPHYFIYAAERLGMYPNLVATARQVNESMPIFIVRKVMQYKIPARGTVAIYGATFKENCGDDRNSLTPDLARNLEYMGFKVSVYDPYFGTYKGVVAADVSIFAVAHDEFMDIDPSDIKSELTIDIKGIFSDKARKFEKNYWRI